jgi:hypothetical protein
MNSIYPVNYPLANQSVFAICAAGNTSPPDIGISKRLVTLYPNAA